MFIIHINRNNFHNMRVSSYQSDPYAILEAVMTYTVGTPDPLSGEPLQKGHFRTSAYDDLTLSPLVNARPLIPEMPEMTPDETEAEVKKLVKEIKDGMDSEEEKHWIFAPEAGTAVKRVIFVFGVPSRISHLFRVPAGISHFFGSRILLDPIAQQHLTTVSRNEDGVALVVLNPKVIFPDKEQKRGTNFWFTQLDSTVAEDEASLLSCVEAINLSIDKIMKELKIQPANTYFFGLSRNMGGLAAAAALTRPEKFGGVFLLDSPLFNRRKVANGDVPTNKETPVHLIITRDCSKGLMAITEVVLKAKGVSVTHSFKRGDSFESDFDTLNEALKKKEQD